MAETDYNALWGKGLETFGGIATALIGVKAAKAANDPYKTYYDTQMQQAALAQQQTMAQRATAAPWLLPVIIGGAGLVLVLVLKD